MSSASDAVGAHDPTPPEPGVPSEKAARLTYADSFQCIGSACEDTCCKNWTIPVDEHTYTKYQNLPAGPLRTLIVESIELAPQSSSAAPANFAKMRLDDSFHCPMLTEDRLCRIHAECGADYLSATCGSYPRIAHSVGKSHDTALTLSCPEAARLVLLSPDLLYPEEPCDNTGAAIASAAQGARRLQAWFWPIRGAVIALIRNRSYALWQRLFLLGILCRRLDSIGQGEIERSVPDFLRDFEHAVAAGSLRNAMEALPIDRESQLDVVLQLAGMMLHRSQITPRFVDCVHAFTTGIGNGPTATLKSLTANYSTAYDRFYAPFFSRYPHMLENYLINTVVRCEYPFGREAKLDDAGLRGKTESPTMVSEHAALIAQLALIKGLLIGVAGYYRDEFAPVHVVHTVQSASRHFEHHPEFLKASRALLIECGMDGARGMAILLRNRAPMASTPAVRDKRLPVQTDSARDLRG